MARAPILASQATIDETSTRISGIEPKQCVLTLDAIGIRSFALDQACTAIGSSSLLEAD